METLVIILQIVVALGIYNVWLVRPKKVTAYRGKNAKNIKEEFRAYGLPSFVFYLIGFLKLSLATLILAGVWVPGIAALAAAGLAVLMAGAISMHIRVHDPLKKSLPALVMFIMSAAIALLA
jgi:hypothetical protein